MTMHFDSKLGGKSRTMLGSLCILCTLAAANTSSSSGEWYTSLTSSRLQGAHMVSARANARTLARASVRWVLHQMWRCHLVHGWCGSPRR